MNTYPIRASKGVGGALADAMRKPHRKPREAQALLHHFCMAEGSLDAARLPSGPGVRGNGVAVDVSCCELKCASPNARFHVLVDGQLYGPFHHIRVSPLPASEPDESEARDGVTRLPVMAFMPPVEE